MDKIFQITGKNPGFAGQKFWNLLIRGIHNNGREVKSLSSIHMSRQMSHKLFWFNKTENEDGIKYDYVPFINISGLRHIMLFVWTFFYTWIWGLKRNGRTVICDVLDISICLATLFASKLNGMQTIGVMTDMPGLMVSRGKAGSIKGATSINRWLLKRFDKYVFLSEAMNEAVNTKHNPYIVIEGMVNAGSERINDEHSKRNPFSILYAGGLHERYGLKILSEAVAGIRDKAIQLLLYGDGPYVEELKNHPLNNVRYCGLATNDEITRLEQKVSLLVNPRPSNELFTKFSFPSKNLEYMVSGTPLLTTKLPSMPKDYYPYVFLFDEETTEGYKRAIEKVLDLSDDCLKQIGFEARQFVLKEKNNNKQASRIIEMAES